MQLPPDVSKICSIDAYIIRSSPGFTSDGSVFYPETAAIDFALKHEKELGIKIVTGERMVYNKAKKEYFPTSGIKGNAQEFEEHLRGAQIRYLLTQGRDLPEWYSFSEVSQILRGAYLPRSQQGFCIFFTGLSGSGKSTIARALQERLMEVGERPVSLLDGDQARRMLSSELGFSKEDRNLNVQRLGYVAAQAVKPGGAVLVAPIAPYEASRIHARDSVEKHGRFVEVYISTRVEVCETRDNKGVYKRARMGLLQHFTGVDDPYEVPQNPEIRIDTATTIVTEAVEEIVTFLQHEGYLCK